MAETSGPALYGGLGEVVIDDGRLEIHCAQAGPAGSSVIELPDGSTWEVDHAREHVPVMISVDVHDATASPLVAAAFGSAAVDDLEQHMRGTVSGPDEVGNGDIHRDDIDDGDASSRPAERYGATVLVPPDDPRTVIGRMIVLHEMSRDTGIHPVAAIAAAVEFLVMVDSEVHGHLFSPVRSELTSRVEALVAEVDEEDLEELHPVIASRLASLCSQAAKAHGDGGPALDELARWLDHMGSDGFDRVTVAAMTAPEPRHMTVRDLTPTRPPGAPVVEPGHIEIQRVTPTMLRVVAARRDHGRWVRVFHRDGLVLLSQAPLLPEDLAEVAEVVIPPDVTDSELEVQIVDIDALRPEPARPLELIGEAVRIGRRAARAGRLGNRESAAGLWRRCAELWEAIGDDDRASLARSMIDTSDIGPAVVPYLADEVSEALDRVD